MELDAIQEKCKCCSCDISLVESEHVNMISLTKQARWEYPVAGNILTGGSTRAVAVICDDCWELGRNNQMKTIKYAIEFQDDQVIYHPIENLSDLN